jgi:hypothetical protein
MYNSTQLEAADAFARLDETASVVAWMTPAPDKAVTWR